MEATAFPFPVNPLPLYGPSYCLHRRALIVVIFSAPHRQHSRHGDLSVKQNSPLVVNRRCNSAMASTYQHHQRSSLTPTSVVKQPGVRVTHRSDEANQQHSNGLPHDLYHQPRSSHRLSYLRIPQFPSPKQHEPLAKRGRGGVNIDGASANNGEKVGDSPSSVHMQIPGVGQANFGRGSSGCPQKIAEETDVPQQHYKRESPGYISCLCSLQIPTEAQFAQFVRRLSRHTSVIPCVRP